MLKAVIFDFDYTLGDSTDGIAQSIRYGLETLGFPLPPLDAIRKTIGLSLPEAFLVLTGDTDAQKAQRFVKLFHEKADTVMVPGTQLYAGVREHLQTLRDRGYKMAIVTTKRHGTIEQILEKFGAAALFDRVVGGDDVKAAKPDPEGLLFTIDALGVQKDEVLYVGDSLVDAKTAANADTAFAAVLTGTTTREDFEGYNRVYTGENIAGVCGYILNA